jgi:hypothetical protein
MPALTHTRHDHAAFALRASKQQLVGRNKRSAKLAIEALAQRAHGIRLNVKRFACQR